MSKKLMIVDDSRVVYASMSKMLENSGWAAKILFVSSLAYDEMVAQSNALGAKGFLYKPFHREEFLTKLADIVSV